MWSAKYIPEAKKDISKLDGGTVKIVFAGIKKVSNNPLPASEGGYGKPLGSNNGSNLTHFLKIKYKGVNLRVVYTLVRSENVMNIVCVSDRTDELCYDIAEHRKTKYGDDIFKNKFDDI